MPYNALKWKKGPDLKQISLCFKDEEGEWEPIVTLFPMIQPGNKILWWEATIVTSSWAGSWRTLKEAKQAVEAYVKTWY